jgi:hypothetical protein
LKKVRYGSPFFELKGQELKIEAVITGGFSYCANDMRALVEEGRFRTLSEIML